MAAALLLGLACWAVILGIIFAMLKCDNAADGWVAPDDPVVLTIHN